jgi:FlaA1/EpsC-like NDP-sugar epimerase
MTDTAFTKNAVRSNQSAYLRLVVSSRVLILALVHLLGFAAVFAISFNLRFDFALPQIWLDKFWRALPWVVASKLLIFWLSGNFFGWWRYVTFSDLTALLRAATISVLVMSAVDHFLISDYVIPRSVLLMDYALTILLFGGLRSSVRFSRQHFWPAFRSKDAVKVIIFGANELGAMLASRIHGELSENYYAVGFVDADPRKRGLRLSGIPVRGTIHDLPKIVLDTGAQEIFVIADTLSGGALRELWSIANEANLHVKIIPPLNNVLQKKFRLPIRDVDINDLLRREAVQLDSEAIGHLIRNKTVMVTGAAGSIGSEICRQVLKFQPQTLLLVDHCENNLFFIERELRQIAGDSKVCPCVGDILDGPRMQQLFSNFKPHVVFHAAAHKHVPMMEANPGEAIKNNVFGTKQLADVSHRFGVEKFVLISTDKAVNPTSVMGTTKQLAERYVHALSQESKTRFVVVRFGNVLGSAGSVIPIFQEQIRRGGPLTITDPRMTRYFMTIPEASQLVLQAGAMGRGGEVFVLDMGEPVKIVDLAHDLIHLSGVPAGAITIEYTGVRPGEKLYEELYYEEETTLETTHPKLRAAYQRPCAVAEILRVIQELEQLTHEPDDLILAKLQEMVPEYRAPNLTKLATDENGLRCLALHDVPVQSAGG